MLVNAPLLGTSGGGCGGWGRAGGGMVGEDARPDDGVGEAVDD